MSAKASDAPRRYRPGLFEWTGLEFLRPTQRPSTSQLVVPRLTGVEQPWPLMLPLPDELPGEDASLLEICNFIARFDPTRHFREHWGERYREEISRLWNGCAGAYRGNRKPGVAPGELLMCLAHDWRLGPRLGVVEHEKLAFLRWLIAQLRGRV